MKLDGLITDKLYSVNMDGTLAVKSDHFDEQFEKAISLEQIKNDIGKKNGRDDDKEGGKFVPITSIVTIGKPSVICVGIPKDLADSAAEYTK